MTTAIEQSCRDAMVSLADHNRSMVENERIRRAQGQQVKQVVGYLLDSAVPHPDDTGEYVIVSGAAVDELREMVFGKRGEVANG